MQILSDSRSRKRYDYALAHPEEDIQEEAYGIWKYWRTDVRAVLLGAVLVVSAIQYFAKKATYEQVRSHCNVTGPLPLLMRID